MSFEFRITSLDKDRAMRSHLNAAIERFNDGDVIAANELSKEFVGRFLPDCIELTSVDILDTLYMIFEHNDERKCSEIIIERKRQIENLPGLGSLAIFSPDYLEVDRKIIFDKPAFVVNGRYPIVDHVVYVQGVNHKHLYHNIFDILDPYYSNGLEKYPVYNKRTFFLGSIPQNFWHFLFNIVSRLAYLSLRELEGFEQFVCFGALTQKQREILIAMGVQKEKILLLSKDYSAHFENLTIYPPGAHSHICDNSETGTALYHDPNAIRSMKSRITKYLGVKVGNFSEPIFIWRRPEGKRDLINQDEIVQHLGFKVVDPIDCTLLEEFTILSHASLVIGSYGAGLASLLFAPNNIDAIQLGINDNQASFFALISNSLEQNFMTLNGCPVNEYDHTNWKEIDRADYIIDINELDDLIQHVKYTN